MKAETVTTVSDTELLDLRQRVGALSNRRSTLRRQVEAAGDREGDLRESVEAAKEALAEGSGGQAEVAAASKALSDHLAGLGHLREALGKVELEHGAVGAEVRSRELKLETARQDEASEGLRRGADVFVETFIKGIAEVAAPLADRGALAVRLLRELPLARPVEPLTLDELAVRLRAKLRLDDRVDHREIVAFIRRSLAGPGETFTHHHLQRLFLKE